MHAVSAGAVAAVCETDDGALLMLPGGRMIHVPGRSGRCSRGWRAGDDAPGSPPDEEEPLVIEFVDTEDPATASARTSALYQSVTGPARFSKENRRRLSGPGLRTFVRIADL